MAKRVTMISFIFTIILFFTTIFSPNVLGCTAYNVRLYVGKDEEAAKQRNTATVYVPETNTTFGFFVEWDAYSPDTWSFEAKLYDGGGEIEKATPLPPNPKEWSGTDNLRIQIDDPPPAIGDHTITATVERIGTGVAQINIPPDRTVTVYKVEIDSVQDRYHAKGSDVDATITYTIYPTSEFTAGSAELNIKDKDGTVVYTRIDLDKAGGSHTTTWPASSMNAQDPNKSPFIAWVKIGKSGQYHEDAGDASDEKIYIFDVEIEKINGNPVGNFNGKIYVPSGGGNPSLTVTAQLTYGTNPLPISGITVYWTVEDTDEPSGYVPNDTNSNAYDNNEGSNSGFGTIGTFATSSQTDANGEAQITFKGSDYGGDNYVIRVHTKAGDQAYTAGESFTDDNGNSTRDSGELFTDNNGTTHSANQKTPVITVWKKIYLEGVDALSGYSAPTGVLTSQLPYLYVEHVLGSNNNTVSSSYYPYSNGNCIQAAKDTNDPPNTDLQILVLASDRQEYNFIDPDAPEPYDSSHDYSFVNWGNGSDDLKPQENALTGWNSNYYEGGEENFAVYIWSDDIAAQAEAYEKINANATFAKMKELVLLHEVGHELTMVDEDENPTSIMRRVLHGSQQEMNQTANQIVNYSWSDTSGTAARKDYVPNTP